MIEKKVKVLVKNILNNLILEVKRIHFTIRYQSRETKSPFGLGIMIDELTAFTSDSFGSPIPFFKFNEKSKNNVFWKRVKLENLSIYSNDGFNPPYSSDSEFIDFMDSLVPLSLLPSLFSIISTSLYSSCPFFTPLAPFLLSLVSSSQISIQFRTL